MSELEMYNQFCKPQFDTVEKNQDAMAKDISKIQVRLFNGMGKSIERIERDVADMKQERNRWNRSKARIARDVLLLMVGSGGLAGYIIPLLTK